MAELKNCETCGEPFSLRYKGFSQRFCSQKCRRRDKRSDFTVCTSCRKEMPTIEKYFQKVKGKSGRLFFRKQCKQCVQKRARPTHKLAYYERGQKEKAAAYWKKESIALSDKYIKKILRIGNSLDSEPEKLSMIMQLTRIKIELNRQLKQTSS